MKLKRGTTSFVLERPIQDTRSQSGGFLTGLVYNTANLTFKWRQATSGAAWTTVTLAAGTAGTYVNSGGAGTGGGFVETSEAGFYAVSLPDALCAAAGTRVLLKIDGAVNMLPLIVEIELDTIDYQDGVRAGLSSLPNAAASAAGGLLTFGTGSGQLNPDGAGNVPAIVRLMAPSVLALSNAVKAIGSDRVDFLVIGDSEVLRGGYGYDEGLSYALNRYGSCFASPLLSLGENNGSGAAQGYTVQVNPPGTPGTLPTQLSPYVSAALYQNAPFYGTISPFNTHGLNADVASVIGLTGALTAEYHYGTFGDGATHNFRPVLHYNSGGYVALLDGGNVNCTTGTYGMARVDLSLAADASRASHDLWASWTDFSSSTSTNVFAAFNRLVNTDRKAGWSVHALVSYGGQPLRVHAGCLIAAADTELTYRFAQLRRLQGLTKRIVVIIEGGQNDEADSGLSVGPKPAASNTQAGYWDNLDACANRIRGIWLLNGWPLSELLFVVQPTHPRAGSGETWLANNIRPWAGIWCGRQPQTRMMDLSLLTTQAYLSAQGYYDTPGDAHLTQAGYRYVGQLIVDELLNATEWLPSDRTLLTGRLAASAYTAPDNASVAAIKAKTDNLPADPASNTQVNTRLSTGAYTPPDNASVAAIKAKTDNLPADPASNTQVATRLAAGAYTAPDNANIGAIKAKTDLLSNVWIARVLYDRDQPNLADEYTVVLTLNGAEVAGVVTLPRITVRRRADNSNLINAQTMTLVGGAAYRYTASGAERQAVGEAVLVYITATIDGTPRVFLPEIQGRDAT